VHEHVAVPGGLRDVRCVARVAEIHQLGGEREREREGDVPRTMMRISEKGMLERIKKKRKKRKKTIAELFPRIKTSLVYSSLVSSRLV
jgi:hypothetical protein